MNLKLILFFTIVIISYTKAQKTPQSLYFEDIHPFASRVKNPENFYGVYQDTTAQHSHWIINKEGIFTATTIPLRVPRAKVRESSKYTIRNGYLFGVKKNDSLKFFIQDSSYVVGIPQKQLQARWNDEQGKAIVKKGRNGSLYLHYKVDDYFSISKLEFQHDQLTLFEFEYSPKIDVFQQLKKSQTVNFQNLPTLIIDPKRRTWRKENLENLFVKTGTFRKSNK